MSTTIRSTVTAVSLSVVVAAAALAGFALADDGNATAATVTSPQDGTTSPPGAPAPTKQPAADPGALLDAGQMPRVNEVQAWRVATAAATFVGFDPEVLGATDIARRDFEMPGGKAASVVLRFADEASAEAAYADVLDVTKADLRDALPAGGTLLYGPGETVTVEATAGQAAFSSIIYKDDPAGEEGWFEWVGAVQLGDTVSVVAWRVAGTDASYEVDPTIAALQAASEALAR
jgi:hypothetical protein